MQTQVAFRDCTLLSEVDASQVAEITVQRWQNEGLTTLSDLQSIAYFLHVHRDKRCKWRDTYECLCSTKSDMAYVSFQIKEKS